ncbi:hypothetical protein INF35_09140 [Subdoligranulum sp. DSM 109015]|uniref:Uncharacterized protein n=1 Tax=Gemmiger gallinarum TaxID=2779354 RepID=A0ABR9R4V3_9FIRM|nr:HAD domain-containing protein [Gemmiger gallinarum]MBE5037947.1 hypothetical protein [Gemmiger gallinarum]
MKVIFLDVDGVLCTPLSVALSNLLRLPMDRQLFDPAALFWLRRLVKTTGAAVVLSSSWREELYRDEPVCRAVIDNLYRALARNHTPITDVTPLLEQGGKGAEIAAWLQAHPCRGYAVLDDRDCFGSAPAVGEHWIQVPPERGLRYREYLAARQLLR